MPRGRHPSIRCNCTARCPEIVPPSRLPAAAVVDAPKEPRSAHVSGFEEEIRCRLAVHNAVVAGTAAAGLRRQPFAQLCTRICLSHNDFRETTIADRVIHLHTTGGHASTPVIFGQAAALRRSHRECRTGATTAASMIRDSSVGMRRLVVEAPSASPRGRLASLLSDTSNIDARDRRRLAKRS